MKIKVSMVARELGLKAKEVVDIAKEIGIEAKVRGEITPMEAAKIQEYFLNAGKAQKKEIKEVKKEVKKEEKKPQRRRRRSNFNELVSKTKGGITVVKKAEPKKEEKKETKEIKEIKEKKENKIKKVVI